MATIYGLNYEGGKIIKHVLQQIDCLAYANVQIRMDSPWSGEVADEVKRQLGPYETQLDGYAERKLLMIDKLTSVLQKAEKIIMSFGNVRQLVIQIARGKACQWFIPDIIMPIIETLSPTIKSMITLVKGYKKPDYYNHNIVDGPFIFINVGMFASVAHCDLVEVCVPVKTFDLDSHLNICQWNEHTDDFGILVGLTPMILGGIADDAPFIEPKKYDYHVVLALFKNI